MAIYIDGDMIVYKAAFAAESKSKGDLGLEYGINVLKSIINTILKDCKNEELVGIVITNPVRENNYREHVAVSVPYKSNRNDRPKYHPKLLYYLKTCYNKYIIEAIGMEADDILGWMKFRGNLICTDDKDLNMVPGRQYNIRNRKLMEHTRLGVVTNEPALVKVTEEHRKYNKDLIVGNYEPLGDKKFYFDGFKGFCCQLITGDDTDSIPGLVSNGKHNIKSNKCPTRCIKLFQDLNTVKECWLTVAGVYASEGMTEEYFVEQVMLLWMQQFPGNTFPTEEQLNA